MFRHHIYQHGRRQRVRSHGRTPPPHGSPAKADRSKVSTPNRRDSVSCSVTGVGTERVNLCRRQIMVLPGRTKTSVTWSASLPNCPRHLWTLLLSVESSDTVSSSYKAETLDFNAITLMSCLFNSDICCSADIAGCEVSGSLDGPRVRISPVTWMSVSCERCALLGRGLCIGLITRLEESYRVGASECDREA